MNCPNCQIVHGELLDKHGNVTGTTEHIDICPVHSLTEMLAEALRDTLAQLTPDILRTESAEQVLALVKEYDSAKSLVGKESQL